MTTPRELTVIARSDSLGRLVAEPFNPDDPRHAALFEALADDCPECRAARYRARKHRAEAGEHGLD